MKIINKATVSRKHAASVNARYEENKANMVTIKDRWNQTLASEPIEAKNTHLARLANALKRFEKRFPKIKSFKDPNFRICKAIPIPMSWLCLDTTIQRALSIDHVLDILEDFVSYQVMPVQVYLANPEDLSDAFDPSHSHWASWDGQHTAVALWIIATMIFKEDPDSVMIPSVEYDMRNRAECRTTFIANNSKENKKILSAYDLASQMVFGVKLDGIDDPEWTDTATKQDLLASYQLFFTDSTRYDHTQSGALTRVKDVFKTKYDVLENICIYSDQILTYGPRAIDTKEFPIIQHFFEMAKAGNVDYTEDEIRSLANLCKDLFDGNFDENGPYWAQVGEAYTNWHNDYYSNWDQSERPGCRLNKDVPQGLTFFWFQLKRSWKNEDGTPMRLPRLNITTSFKPDAKDLF